MITLHEESTRVREQLFVEHSAGMTTSHRTGSTLSGKVSEINVEMRDVFPTRATHHPPKGLDTISKNDHPDVLLHGIQDSKQ